MLCGYSSRVVHGRFNYLARFCFSVMCGVSFVIDFIVCTLNFFLNERSIGEMKPQLDKVGCGDGPYGLCA